MAPPSAPDARKRLVDAGGLIAFSAGALSKPHSDFPLAKLRQYKSDDIDEIVRVLRLALQLLNGL